MDWIELRSRIETAFDEGASREASGFSEWFPLFIESLTRGEIRAARPTEDGWAVEPWVKKGILLGFRYGDWADYSIDRSFRFFDKDTYPLRPTQISDQVRLVPGGSSVRAGSYLAPGVVVMPPAYVNVGAYVGPGTMIDSHALVGSCAQVGERVHLSAGSQIGGVLEPVGASPVIVEDDVMIGGNCGIYEGIQIGRRAVIGAGTILTASIPVFDLVHEKRFRGGRGMPLRIPENAVVVPGSRAVGRSEMARREGLAAGCALIVKYRDERTDAATALEESLR